MGVFWFALAAFATGMEAFVLAGLLPTIAGALHVPFSAAGQLVTVYALTYAIGSPVLAVMFNNVERKTTLTIALVFFIICNLLAAVAPSFVTLMACRMGMALGTGLANPTSLATVVAISPPERRGRAVASVMAGLTVATVLGMPLGTLIGAQITWRAPFILAAMIAAVALGGIVWRLPAGLHTSTVSLADRFAVMRNRDVVLALATTTLWSTGTFTVFTYLSVQLREVGFGAAEVSGVLFVYGAACAGGNLLSGQLADRLGTGATSMIGLCCTSASLVLLAATLSHVAGGAVRYLVLAPVALWGLGSWCFNPAQVASIGRALPTAAAIAVSLNASFMNLGFAAGGAIGGFVLTAIKPTSLGYIGGASTAAALTVLLLRERMARRRSVSRTR